MPVGMFYLLTLGDAGLPTRALPGLAAVDWATECFFAGPLPSGPCAPGGCAAVDHAWSLVQVSHCVTVPVHLPVIELPRHPADFRSAAPACHPACLAEPLTCRSGGGAPPSPSRVLISRSFFKDADERQPEWS